MPNNRIIFSANGLKRPDATSFGSAWQDLILSGGSITWDGETMIQVRPESGTSDTITSILNGEQGSIVMLRALAGETITVDSTLTGGDPIELVGDDDTVVCLFQADAVTWRTLLPAQSGGGSSGFHNINSTWDTVAVGSGASNGDEIGVSQSMVEVASSNPFDDLGVITGPQVEGDLLFLRVEAGLQLEIKHEDALISGDANISLSIERNYTARENEVIGFIYDETNGNWRDFVGIRAANDYYSDNTFTIGSQTINRTTSTVLNNWVGSVSGYYSGGSSTVPFVIPTDGLYLMNVRVIWESDSSGDVRSIGISLVGGFGTIQSSHRYPAFSSSSSFRQRESFMLELTEGDEVQVEAYHNADSALDISDADIAICRIGQVAGTAW